MTIQDVLNTVKGSKIIAFVSVTEPDWASLKSTGPNPFKGVVRKRSTVNGIVGFIYANSVNRQRVREGLEDDFTPEPRKWGSRIEGTPFVMHNGVLYLEVKVERVLNTEYIDANGQVLDAETIKPFLKPKSESSRQGLEKIVILRDYKIENIVELRMDGQVIAA